MSLSSFGFACNVTIAHAHIALWLLKRYIVQPSLGCLDIAGKIWTVHCRLSVCILASFLLLKSRKQTTVPSPLTPLSQTTSV